MKKIPIISPSLIDNYVLNTTSFSPMNPSTVKFLLHMGSKSNPPIMAPLSLDWRPATEENNEKALILEKLSHMREPA